MIFFVLCYPCVQGNKHFLKKKTNNAITWYTDALKMLQDHHALNKVAPEVDHFASSSDDILEQRKKLRGVLRANLAQCLIRQELYRQALDHCKKGVEVDDSNPKLWFRLATCADRINEWDQVFEALDALDKLEQDVVPKEDIQKLRAKANDNAEDYEDDRETQMLMEMKKDFEWVCNEYDLKSDHMAGKLADLIVAADTTFSGDLIPKICKDFDMPKHDAEKLLKWISVGVNFKRQSDQAAAEMKGEEAPKA